jgi:myo-inositol 2-dehydrogenase/D-chiro-inositol 1-dehydrogenase
VPLRIGVIGAGVMGADHARLIAGAVSGASLAMLADVDLGRASAVADSVGGARVTSDAHALIEDPEVDGVIIASHDSTHAEYVIAAIRAGKPVLCEKPLAPTLEECMVIVNEERRATARTGIPLVSVGFMRRFDPAYLELRAATRASIGRPLLVHCRSRSVSSATGSTSEGSISGSAIHEFDIVPWLLDSRITEVSWHAPLSALDSMQDPQVMLLRTEDGVLTTVETFLNARYGYDIACEVVGETGTVTLENPASTRLNFSGRASTEYAADWRPRFAEAYRLELKAWIDSLASGQRSPLASAHDGLIAVAVASAAIESMRGGGTPTAVRLDFETTR